MISDMVHCYIQKNWLFTIRWWVEKAITIENLITERHEWWSDENNVTKNLL